MRDALLKPRRLADLLAYQDHAVVSQTLIKQAGGTVTLFAFAEEEELTEHTSAYDALVHVLDGEAEITVAGTAHRVPAGEALLLPAGKPHAVRAVSQFKMLLILIKG